MRKILKRQVLVFALYLCHAVLNAQTTGLYVIDTLGKIQLAGMITTTESVSDERSIEVPYTGTDDSIPRTMVITTGGNVDVVSATSIELMPGFEVVPGGMFNAGIYNLDFNSVYYELRDERNSDYVDVTSPNFRFTYHLTYLDEIICKVLNTNNIVVKTVVFSREELKLGQNFIKISISDIPEDYYIIEVSSGKQRKQFLRINKHQ